MSDILLLPCRKHELEENMLMNLQKKSWTHGLTLRYTPLVVICASVIAVLYKAISCSKPSHIIVADDMRTATTMQSITELSHVFTAHSAVALVAILLYLLLCPSVRHRQVTRCCASGTLMNTPNQMQRV